MTFSGVDASGDLTSPHASHVLHLAAVRERKHAVDVEETRALAAVGRSALRHARGGGSRGEDAEMELRSVAAEVAGFDGVHDRKAQHQIDDALALVDGYPVVFAAWADGRITRDHVTVVMRAGAVLPVDARPDFEAAAVDVCLRDIAPRVKEALKVLAASMHPRSFTERHRDAVAGRAVRVIHGEDGMSDVVATVATVLAHGVMDRLTEMARSGKDAAACAAADARRDGDEGFEADTRTMDQRRADAFTDLTLGGAPVVGPTHGADGNGSLGAVRAAVQVVMTSDTLIGKTDDPAELVGVGLIDADTARLLAGNAATWQRLFLDPVTGTVTNTDDYRPPRAMRRMLQARDQHCRFPGCHTPAIRCELDHSVDWALGGHTHILNLAHLCQHHHSMKQFTNWNVTQIGGGVLEWTSPMGRIYREDLPVPAVCFTPAFLAGTPPGAPPGGPPDRMPGEPPKKPPPF